MAKKMFYASLFGGKNSAGSIDRLIKSLEDYKDSLNDKIELYRHRLAEVGIETAKENTGEYGSAISFYIDDENGVTFLIGEGKLILKEWYTDAEKKNKRS